MIDAYAVLAVPHDADQAALKAAHRRLVRRYHPDLVPEPERPAGTVRVRDVNVAYGLIRDPGRRAQYDALRAMSVAPARLQEADLARQWEELSTSAGRWAARWWRRQRGPLARSGVNAIGRVLWLVTALAWGVLGLVAAVAAQRVLGVEGPLGPTTGVVAGALVGSSRGWRRRLRMARLPQPGGLGRYAVAFGTAALTAALTLDAVWGLV